MNVAILGVGSAGRDIAQACARGGCQVSLYAEDATAVMDRIDEIERRLAAAVDTGETTPETKSSVVDRLEATTGLDTAVADAAIVIDTATEDVGVLQRQFADIEELVDRETLIATSQAAVSVSAASAGLRYPDRALGMHFHRPLEAPLVEVVVTEHTTGRAIESAEAFVEDTDGLAVRVRDSPGLASARLTLAQEVEAIRLVEDKIAGVEGVDEVLTRGHDHEIGPLEQADRAGLDKRVTVLEYLADSLGDRYRPPDLLVELVEAGQTGKDAGEGFYVWEGGEPTEPALPGPELVSGDTLPGDAGRR